MTDEFGFANNYLDCRYVTEDEIVDTLCARFDGDREDIKADVHEAIGRLRKIGAIDE